MTEKATVVIGGASGAWGDTSFAAPQLLDAGVCDYLMFEALAEITMAILTRARQKDPRRGYAIDVIEMIGREAGRLKHTGTRVVTNAGGVNPRAAAEALRVAARAAGVALRVGVVTGDDLSGRVDELVDGAEPAPISFHAYLGARPIAAALDAGADVVVTGRCVDSALALGPLIHEHGWGPHDYDLLSQGSLAGHLLECGPQSTGGLLTDFEDVPSWEDLGYPIAEVGRDGRFVLTKASGTGGLVDARTVSEQLIYEIGDPARYLLPDVTCDWRGVTLLEAGPDRVEVTGARGAPPPRTLKACAHAQDGFKVTTLLFVAGRDAVLKGERLGVEAVRRVERTLVRAGFAPLRGHHVEVLGAESTYGPRSRARLAREVVVKVALHHESREALAAAVRELPSFGLAVPGLSGGGRGLARPTPLIRLRNHAVARDRVTPSVTIDDEPVAFEPAAHPAPRAPVIMEPRAASSVTDGVEVPLVLIAHARSGDKGADANIGVRARAPEFYGVLLAQLTSQRVAEAFAHLAAGPVSRFELPGIHAVNFVLEDALGGGGVASLRFDPQGKAYAQQLLDLTVRVPAAWLDHPAARASAS